MTIYLDTSAAAKLVVEEPESSALAGYLDEVVVDDDVVSSVLLETELRRLAVRLDLLQSSVSAVLARVTLVEADRALFLEAGLLPGSALRSLDALHLATAIRMDVSALVAYDLGLQAAAHEVGLTSLAPR